MGCRPSMWDIFDSEIAVLPELASIILFYLLNFPADRAYSIMDLTALSLLLPKGFKNSAFA